MVDDRTMTLARCPWYIAGPLIGLVIIALRATVNRPLGMLGGLLMGSAIAVAAIGARLLRGAGVRSVVTRDAVGWTTLQVHPRHIAGSAIFGTGWSIAATCPGPVTAMIGQGRLGGLLVATGIATGIVLHRLTVGRRATQPASVDRSAACV
jgi:uncharacterized membrane protein YedE/YeeE